jgi:hypothetical protein
MANIPLGLGDWESASQNVGRLKLHNMYIVPSPSSADGVSRVSRPTLSTYTTVGAGPIVKMWQQPNILNGDTLILSGTELYRLNAAKVATKIGNIPGSSRAVVAGTQLIGQPDLIIIVRDGIVYSTNGTTVSIIAMPDNQLANSIASINSYFIITVTNSQRFYWLEPGSVVVDPLNFASAERLPDPIVQVEIVSDEIWFLGTSGPEVWTPTGDDAAPFQRVSGRVYKEGCLNRWGVVNTAIDGLPALIWITDTRTVVKAQGAPTKISNESVEEMLKTTTDLSSWFFRFNRHDFYVISSPLFTLVYDITMNMWARWDTYLLPYWVAQQGIQSGAQVVSGDVGTNKLYLLNEGVMDDTTPIVHEISGFVPCSVQATRINEILAYVNSGWAPSYTAEPTLELRWSDDMGATWSDYLQASLGNKGEYTRVVSYRALGLMRGPGRIFEFRMSDPVRFRLDYATFNERSEG